MQKKSLFRALKRFFDIVVSICLLLLLSPAFVFLAILIKLDTPGMVFYRSQRVGQGGQLFNMLKFRSMYVGADRGRHLLEAINERDGILFKLQNDPRITRTGRWLRRYSLDELPQLWNVMRGEMSLVGPRPPLLNEVAQYPLNALARLSVPQGMTGLWQVYSREHPSFRSYLRWDLFYVHHWCLSLDFHILSRTFTVVVRGTGA